MFTSSIIFLVGLFALVMSAKLLVDNSALVARAVGIPPLVIGLAFLAVGTSLPELNVSIQAAQNGLAGMSWGNVVGSNIANLALVLPICALIRPLPVSRPTIKLDAPFMLGVSLALVLLAWGGMVGFWSGWLLIGCGAVYTALLLHSLKRSKQESFEGVPEKTELTKGQLVFRTVLALVGLALMMISSDYVVSSASTIAKHFEMSDALVGLTIVAIGTSLPELVSSGIAAKKGETDMAIGGLVGSNLCNIMIVLGSAAVISPNGIPVDDPGSQADSLIMLGVAVLFFLFALSGRKISRSEGGILLIGYIGLVAYRIATAQAVVPS